MCLIKIRWKWEWWRQSWRQRSLSQWGGSFALHARLREQKSTFLSYTHLHFFFFWNTHPPTFYNRSSTGSTRINKLKWNKRYQKSKLLLEVLLYFIYFNPWFHSISFGPYNRYIILKHINLNCYSYPVSLKYASHTITNAFKWDNYGKRKLRQNQFKDKDK